MRPSRAAIEAEVRQIVCDALDRKPEQVALSSSLVDDLGAESIDFLDLVFRLETAFGISIPQDQIWAGSHDLSRASGEEYERGLARLRAEMPDFRWDRFPDGVKRSDLPRLLTVRSIVDYLDRFFGGQEAASS